MIPVNDHFKVLMEKHDTVSPFSNDLSIKYFYNPLKIRPIHKALGFFINRDIRHRVAFHKSTCRIFSCYQARSGQR